MHRSQRKIYIGIENIVVSLNVPIQNSSTDECIYLQRTCSLARTPHLHVSGSNDRTFRQVARSDNTLREELPVQVLPPRGVTRAISECRFGSPYLANQRCELFRFQRSPMIRTGKIAIKCDVFFDNLCAKGNRGTQRRDTRFVSRVPDNPTALTLARSDEIEVEVVVWGRVCTIAMKKCIIDVHFIQICHQPFYL